MKPYLMLMGAALLAAAQPALAGPRETLTAAALHAPNKADALAGIAQAQAQAQAILSRDPNNREARLQRAIATAYHAQLTRGLGEAKSAHQQFQALVNEQPNDPEALLALASWHLTAVTNVGSFVAGTMLGASKSDGFRYLSRALSLGRGHAMFPAYAAMLQIQLNPSDVAAARALAQTAARTPAPTTVDQELQRRAAALLVPLNANDGRAAAALAKRLMPLGQLG